MKYIKLANYMRIYIIYKFMHHAFYVHKMKFDVPVNVGALRSGASASKRWISSSSEPRGMRSKCPTVHAQLSEQEARQQLSL